MGEPEIGVGDGLVRNKPFEIPLALTGLRKGRLQPVRVNIQWRCARGWPSPVVLGSSSLTIFSNLRSKRNRGVGDAGTRDDEKR